MIPDKQIKKSFKQIASQDPDTYYATSVLKEMGFTRKQCIHCKTFFWTTNSDRIACGDASCQGGFSFLNKTTTKSLSYIDVYKEFAQQFTQHGYAVIDRFPVVARWNPTTDFTIASIAAFQPFVVSGESQAPASKLVVPQFCLRFGDVANVGVTMSHLTGFVMIGQHQFVSQKQWDQDKAFKEIVQWLTTGLKLPKEDITFHEDAWAGGGNFGPCMEFFSHGVELGNQVYMLYEQDENTNQGQKDLPLKVLDMGMGMERNAWFSQATPTIYDATFPQVIDKLLKATGVQYDKEFMRSYVPYGAYLNLDEIDNLEDAWELVANKMKLSVVTLKQKLKPMTAIFSIAEHARSLLFAFADGALPSNVGGGYNLRVILRRALEFIHKHNWNIALADVCEWHAQELKDIFPKLKESLNDVTKILASEEKKFREGKKRNEQYVKSLIKKGKPTKDDLFLAYESKGISPEEIVESYNKHNVDTPISVPENFYGLLAQRQEEAQQKKQSTTKTKKIQGIDATLEPTQILYYGDWKITSTKAVILQEIPAAKKGEIYIILDKTIVYPTSGGQLHDHATFSSADGSQSAQLISAFKQGPYIIHHVKGTMFRAGDQVSIDIDLPRRTQLTQHHTATHIINGACRELLGNHVWQAGASKTLQKARLDITHYDALTQEDLDKIEKRANEIVKEAIPIIKKVLPRAEAEKEFGFRLYQGGAVPGSDIRVVSIPGVDTEACGGTHLNNTLEAQYIHILKSTKIQDGIVRIEFVAGNAAKQQEQKGANVLLEAAKLLSCKEQQVPARCEELFLKWKKAKKKKLALDDFTLTSTHSFEGDILGQAATILRTQPEHIPKTIQKFLKQLEEYKEKAK
ncbi:MAG: alanine--tRNA ligase [Candidatus Woesearchaeota archaeon]